MSSQAQLPVMPENQPQNTSLLDQPWRVALLPADAPANETPRRHLPWRPGDVTRLKDDTPEGMMRYIATHTTGWWQEMAERALRDTEKAERMAREAGWQPGQYWQLEVDAEAKQKLMELEEAKRKRDEEERAREAAEKEAFMKRQIELLKKAGRAPRCEYESSDGRKCRAPQVKGERWCHGHAKTMSYRPEQLEILPMEDEHAVMVNLYRVTKSLLAGRITEKVAGLALWSVAIGAPGAGRVRKTHRGGAETRRKAKNLPRMNADAGGSQQINPGVTRDKCFVSGVDTGVPGTKLKGSVSRENSLCQHCHNRHSGDLSTPPRGAHACSESLKMTGDGRRGTREQRDKLEIKEVGDREINRTSSSQGSLSVACPRGGRRI